MDLEKVREKDPSFGLPWVPGDVVLPFGEADSAVQEYGKALFACCMEVADNCLMNHLYIARDGGIGHMTDHAEKGIEMFCSELRLRKRLCERMIRDRINADPSWQQDIFDLAGAIARMDAMGIYPSKARRSA